MIWSVVFGVTIYFIASDCKKFDLPINFPRCHRRDPQLNKCLLDATNDAKRFIKHGIKEIGMPPMNKYKIPYFKMLQYNPAYINATFINFTLHRLDDYNFEEVRYDTKTLTISGKIKFKEIYTTASFVMDAYILFTKIIGKGSFTGPIGPTELTYKISGKLIKKEAVYYYPVDCNVTMIIEGFKLNIKGLANPTNLMHTAINKFINDNSREVVLAATPSLAKLTEKLFLRYVTYLTSKIPYDKLLEL